MDLEHAMSNPIFFPTAEKFRAWLSKASRSRKGTVGGLLPQEVGKADYDLVGLAARGNPVWRLFLRA
jgi:hypothetical protein